MKRPWMWLGVAAWWLYFDTAVVLYDRGVIWANTLDLLFGFGVLLVLSTWYGVDRLRRSVAPPAAVGDWALGYLPARKFPGVRPAEVIVGRT